MTEATRRGVKEGIGSGLIAGVVLATAGVAVASNVGVSLLMPFRMFASVVLGEAALETTPTETATLVGVVTHLVLSSVFGLIYGLVNALLSAQTQTRWGRQIGLGMLFGVALWLLNFQILARAFYPQFLTAPKPLEMLMHALFFGLPLGLTYAGAERRAHRVRHAHAHA